jgi:hypothetical protein
MRWCDADESATVGFFLCFVFVRNVAQPTRIVSDTDVVVFDKETDAIYEGAFQNGSRRTMTISDPAAHRVFRVRGIPFFLSCCGA